MGKASTVECSAADRSWKQLPDLVDQSASRGLELPDNRIRVEYRYSSILEHPRNRRLSHADRTGERDPDHVSSSPRSRSAPRSAISGIPRIVKWSPSMLS